MRVGWIDARLSVVLLGFTSIEVLGWAAESCRSTGVEIWIGTRRLSRRRHVVTPKVVLVEGLGKSLFQHPVVVSYSSLQLGMEIKQGI